MFVVIMVSPTAQKSNDEIYNDKAIAHNAQIFSFCRTIASAAGGCAAGIIGLTNLNGCYFYLLVHLITSAVIQLKIESTTDKKSKTKIVKSKGEIWYENLFGGATTYILFWTLVYGIVHVY